MIGLEELGKDPIVSNLLEALNGVLLILDTNRNVLGANLGVLEQIGRDIPGGENGLRPGEILECHHALKSGAECGSDPFCGNCEINRIIKESIHNGERKNGECLLTVRKKEGSVPREFQVTVIPLIREGEPLTLVCLRDITGEKRRQLLEQMFLHDILNTVGGLGGWSQLIQNRNKTALEQGPERIEFLTRQLERDIRAHWDLILAEMGRIKPSFRAIDLGPLLEVIQRTYEDHPLARGKHLLVMPLPPAFTELVTDENLLNRVLSNMVVNALEASPPNEQVRIWVESDENTVSFHVSNRGIIPMEALGRLFQGQFTNKPGKGRGIGTYIMRLFGESYLGGNILYHSNPESGTTFSLRLPRTPSEKKTVLLLEGTDWVI